MKWKTRIAHIRRARGRKGAGSVTTREREAGAAAAGAGADAGSPRQPGAGRRPAPRLERGTQTNTDRARGGSAGDSGTAPSEGGVPHVGGAAGASGRGAAALPLRADSGLGYPCSTDQHTSTHDHGRGTNQSDGERAGGAGGGRVGRVDGAVQVGSGGQLPCVAVAEPAGTSGSASGFRGSRRAESGRVRSFGRPGQFGGSCAFYGGPGFGRRLGHEPGRAAGAGEGRAQGGPAVAGDEMSAALLAGKPIPARVPGGRAWEDTLHIMRTSN